MKKYHIIAVWLFFLVSIHAAANENVANGISSNPDFSDAQNEMQWRTNATILGTVSAGVLYGYFLTDWWKQGFTGELKTVNEGWFGQNTYAGGADKLGHAYSAYVGARLLARSFEGYGHDTDTALRLGVATSFGALLAVEALDGFSRENRFSYEDVIMNGAGAGLAMLLEKYPALDRILDFRLHYWPSDIARREGNGPVTDYSGQTYLLVAKAAGVPVLRQYQPLRYLELAVGYSTRGYRPDEGVNATHSRFAYLGISLNLAEILDDVIFKESRNSNARRNTGTLLEYIQIPGTASVNEIRLD